MQLIFVIPQFIYKRKYIYILIRFAQTDITYFLHKQTRELEYSIWNQIYSIWIVVSFEVTIIKKGQLRQLGRIGIYWFSSNSLHLSIVTFSFDRCSGLLAVSLLLNWPRACEVIGGIINAMLTSDGFLVFSSPFNKRK